MPELPEVETIVRYLRPKIRGKRILGMKVLGKRVLRAHKSPTTITKAVAGKIVKNIRRLGKNIIFDLSGGTSFVIHLMMTGRLLLNPPKLSEHDRLIVGLSGGDRLVFNDIRQFGWCRVTGPRDWLAGPDALSLGLKKFKNLIAPRRGLIKSLFLNQKIISGIGNIYSDEILWYSGIRPTRKADTLSEKELKKLFQAMRRVLLLAIKKEGTSSRDYRKPDGTEGGYYKVRKAYQRTGEKCSRDSEIIQRIKMGGRSAHFCPRHQK